MPAHDASGLQQATCAQGRFADEQARAEADAAGKLIGLGCQHRANFDRGGAERDARAELEIEPRKQRRVGGGAECSVALRERLCELLLRVERHRAVERIGCIHRLHLDQRRTPVLRARHGAHGGGERYAASPALASRRLRENARSPPRMTRPSRARPSASPDATEPTPAIAMTPSAMQAMNT